ncbi:MAG: DUF2752 domain-containing protein [Muribaculaceae bacterium]|nr:DUF2752 domain-containing protein [Muribaculaceae bacterium]
MLGLASFYFYFNPGESRWMPQCLFHKFTGLNCMGCGAQRMFHSLLHGDFVAAFHANALLFCLLPVFAFMVIIEVKRESFPNIYKKIHTRPIILGFVILLTLWIFIRNIIGI